MIRRPMFWCMLAMVVSVAVVFLWLDRSGYAVGVLPWLVVLACPLMHVFMHHGHRGAHHHGPDRKDRDN